MPKNKPKRIVILMEDKKLSVSFPDGMDAKSFHYIRKKFWKWIKDEGFTRFPLKTRETRQQTKHEGKHGRDNADYNLTTPTLNKSC